MNSGCSLISTGEVDKLAPVSYIDTERRFHSSFHDFADRLYMQPYKTLLFAASVRPGRMNDRVLEFVKQKLQNHVVEIVDPLEWDLPLLTTPYRFYANPEKEAPEKLRKLVALVSQAQCLIFTTAEYNRSMPPALTNLIDYLPYSALGFKPAGIIGYSMGNSGGMCAVWQLRQMLSELGCIVVPHQLTISKVHACITEDGKLADSSDFLNRDMDLMMNQIQFMTEAFETYRRAADSKPQPPIHL